MATEFTAGDHLINVRVGDEFVIALESNPTTGYQWQPIFDPAFIELIDDQFTAASAGMGSAGTHRIRFKVLAAGDGTIRVVKKRPWEAAPVEEIGFELHLVG